MTILIDPQYDQVRATENLAANQARSARALEEANRLSQEANDLKREEIYLLSLTIEERKDYFVEKERLKIEAEKALNEFLIKAFKILGIVIVVITLYVWLK
jgi:CRISPR/Cas system CMR-associated protein Cmr5 small subunit